MLPILQILPNLITGDIEPTVINTAQDIAPVTIEIVPEGPIEKEDLEKPKLEKPKPKRTIHELANLLNPGMGGVGGTSLATDLNGLMDTDEDLANFDLKDLDRKPHPLFQAEPTNPYSLKNQRIEGWVIIEWVITHTGHVLQPRVVQS